MFGFSVSKILFTIVAVAAIWYGFKFIQRVQDSNKDSVSGRRRPGVDGGANRAPAGRDDDDVETMIECRVCGSFVAASGARSCGREDCPYPG